MRWHRIHNDLLDPVALCVRPLLLIAMIIPLACVGAAAALALGGTHNQSTDGTTVLTWDGPITGISGEYGQSWRGVPYATQPVGAMRWKAPARPTPWKEPLSTDRFGPGCPQQCELPPMACQAAISEACLSLNLYRPFLGQAAGGGANDTAQLNDAQSPSSLPLMPTLVWFHGGA
jgi:carboxylesterase type B